jgi:PAS domain S-box-containing protein
MYFFQLFTPISYWLLTVLWLFIFVFYIIRIRKRKLKSQLFVTLLIILAIDAFRTLFESLYFGAWYTSLVGFIPISVHDFLVRPENVFVPKFLNVVAAFLIIFIVLRRWIPEEEAERERELEYLKRIEKEKTFSESLVNSLPGIMYVIDKSGQLKNWNRNFELISGYGKKDILNKNVLDLIAIENESIVRQNITKVFETGYGSVEAGLSTQSGETIPYLLTGFKFTQEDVDYLIGVGLDISERIKTEQEKAKLIKRLQETLSALKTLGGLLPICSSCKKIRDDKGYWNQIELYIRERSDAEFSHGICPECAEELYGEELRALKEKGSSE